MTVPIANGGRQDPVYVDEETEEETKLTFSQGGSATTFDVEVNPTGEGVFLKFRGRYVIHKLNNGGNFKTLVLAREGTPKPEPVFLSFQPV